MSVASPFYGTMKTISCSMLHLFPTRTVALMIGPLSVHWYGVMYACAFIVGLWIFRRLQRYRNLQLSEQQIDSMFLSLFLGVLIGGRLGYVLFYGDALYFSDPLEILRVWHGGMASHGGFIGVLIAMIIFTRRTRISFLSLCDVLTVPIALGLAFGRDRKSTRLNSSHVSESRMPSSA